MKIIWYQREKLRAMTRKAAIEWISMNYQTPGGDVTVIPVSSTTAVVEYEQDLGAHIWCILYFAKGCGEPLFLSPDELDAEGNRRLKSRVERARRMYRNYQADVAREQHSQSITE